MYNLGLNPTVRNTGLLISNSRDQYYNHRIMDWRRITNTCCQCSGSPSFQYYHFANFNTRRMSYWLGNGLTGESKIMVDGECTTCNLLPLTTDLRAQDAAIIHYHRDDNPVISNCIPHPSHYDIEYDTYMISDSSIGIDFYEHFKTKHKKYCILDTKLNEYYEIQYSAINNQIFINRISNVDDKNSITYSEGLQIIIDSVKYRITLVNKVLIVDESISHFETQDEFYVKDVDFALRYDSSIKDEYKDATDVDMLQYYKLSINPEDNSIIFIKDISKQRNMYETPYQKIIHNKQISDAYCANIIMRDKHEHDYQSFSLAFGSKNGILILPYITMSLNGAIYDFRIDSKNELGDIYDESNIFLTLYDENFVKITEINIEEVHRLEFNFELAWVEVQKAAGEFDDITYVGASDAKFKQRFNLNKSKKIFVVMKHLNSDRSMNPTLVHEFIKNYREIKFKFKPKDKAEVSDKIEEFAKGVIEFRAGINLANISKITTGVLNEDHCNPNTNPKRLNSNIDNPYYAYHHGCVGFHYIEKGIHKYILFVNKFAEQIYHDKFKYITSTQNVDISILHIIRGSSKQFDVYKIDDEFINDLCKNYNITGQVRFICPNLPIRFEFQRSYRYEFIPFFQEHISSWITNGIHSNFDECKTGIYVNGIHNSKFPTQVDYHTLDRFREEHVFAGARTKAGSYTGIHKHTMFRFVCNTGLHYYISYALRGRKGVIRSSGYKTHCGSGQIPYCTVASYHLFYRVTVVYKLTAIGQGYGVEGTLTKDYSASSCLYSDYEHFYAEQKLKAQQDIIENARKATGHEYELIVYSVTGERYYPTSYYGYTYFTINYWPFQGNTYSYYIGSSSTVFKVNDYLNEQYLRKDDVDIVKNENIINIESFTKQEDQRSLIPSKIRIFVTKFIDKPIYHKKEYYQNRNYATSGTNEYMVLEKEFDISSFMYMNTVERYLTINANDFKYPGSGTTHNDYMITTVEFEYHQIPRSFDKLRKNPATPNKFYDEYWNEIDVSENKKYVAYPTKTMILPRIEFKLDNYGAVEGYVDTRYVHKENDKSTKHSYFTKDNDVKNKMKFVDTFSYMKLSTDTILPQESVKMANVEFHSNKIYRG